MSNWIEPIPVSIPSGFQDRLGVSALVAELLIKRGLTSPALAEGFLDPQKYQPSPPFELPGIQQATDLILQAIRKRTPILVWGDFDVDGQTATTILVSGLRQMDGLVDYYIPIREQESHGVHIPRLSAFIDKTGLLITCDTGITAYAAIQFAKEHGITTIITDHHDLPDELPPASVIVNPKFLPSGHPLQTLPGAGVAYKLIESLYTKNGMDHTQFLDLVALGIVADIAELVGDTRFLLQLGLEHLRNTRRCGLQALYEQAEIQPDQLSADHISYGIAPRLNAIGRLADANKIVDFLTTQDRTQARIMAIELEALNAQRKLLTDQVFEGVMAQLDRNPGWLRDPAIVLDHTGWPGGVIGIVASRLVDYFHKPVILIATSENGIGRGSARSIAGVNVTQAIATQSGLLEGFGGHPAAGGFSIRVENIPAFRDGILKALQEQMQQIAPAGQLQIDAWIGLNELSLSLAQEIYQLSPFGAGNPPVILAAKDIQILRQRKIGRYGEHLKITIVDPHGNAQDVLWWQGAGYPLPESGFDLAYTVRPTNFQGNPGIEITWIEARETSLGTIALEVKEKPTLIDCRNVESPESEIQNHIADPDHVLWCEVLPSPGGHAADRRAVTPHRTLIIWTIPPSRPDLLKLIRTAQPEKIVFFALNPNIDEQKVFLARLAGMIKYLIRHAEGVGSLETLAAGTAHSEITVQLAIQWLCARGDLSFIRLEDGSLRFQSGDRLSKPETRTLEDQLKLLLVETAAFRKYYCYANLSQLIS